MTTRDAMTCINCGARSEYNRRVERLDTGRVLGGLCESCEQARFGDALRTMDAPEQSACLYCDARPAYALPEHVVSLDDDAATECEVSGYFVTAETPRLCRAHVDAMRPETGTFWPGQSTTADAGD
jgi:hypothetical protein